MHAAVPWPVVWLWLCCSSKCQAMFFEPSKEDSLSLGDADQLQMLLLHVKSFQLLTTEFVEYLDSLSNTAYAQESCNGSMD